ncbi:MAG TPA: small acid-soluble spore protein Tlp [Clostridiaceae bacterium]|jgi:small acid-soluble spore protein (thioredoxin-like protein)|nr:small acid-soluble spore protein Tlp [Clostridiaceae bacterium]
MKPKPDDRRDNARKIRNNIKNTIENIELAEDMIDNIDNEKTIHDLKAKNERRREAVEGMRQELKDETRNQFK